MDNTNRKIEDNDLNLPFEKLNVSYYREESKDTQYSTQQDQEKKHHSIFEKCGWKTMETQDLSTEDNNFKYVYPILSNLCFY